MAARETGVVRQRLGGDTAAAQRLNGIARAQLGILKELMAFGNLQQLSRTVRLGDGTEIFVQSVFGQDSIRITPPVAAVEVAGEEEEVSGQGAYVYVVGFTTRNPDGTYVARRWKVSADGRGLLSTDLLISNATGTALVMSVDGSSIALTGKVGSDIRTYLWRDSIGAVDLGISNLSNTVAPLISNDGSVVVSAGYDAMLADWRLYRWSADVGLVDLGLSLSAPSAVMSADGNIIAASTYDALSGEYRVLRWTTDGAIDLGLSTSGDYIAMSSDGAVIAGISFDPIAGTYGFFRWVAADGAVNLGITDRAYGYPIAMSANGDSIFVPTYHAATAQYEALLWTISAGVIDIGVYGYGNYNPALSDDGLVLMINHYDSISASYRISRWTASVGLFDLGPSAGGIAPKMSSDGTISAFTAIISGGNPCAVRWTDSGGATYLGSSTPDIRSLATAVSSDGAVVAGDSWGSPTAWTPYERLTLGSEIGSVGGLKTVTKIFYD